jgi:malonyl-CoA O-methyltransferase
MPVVMPINTLSPLDKKKVQQGFNRAVKTYNKSAILQKKYAIELCDRLKSIKFHPTRILDLGSGTGIIYDILKKQYPQAQVVKYDIAFMALLQNKTNNDICGDCGFLPFANTSFDLVISGFMLQWCDNLRHVFQQIYDTLKKNGVFIFSTFGLRTLEELRYAWSLVDDNIHVNDFYDIQQIGDFLNQNQFTNITLDKDYVTEYEKNAFALMKKLKNLGATNSNHQRIKNLSRREYFIQLDKQYQKMANNNGIPVSYEVIMGIAWK